METNQEDSSSSAEEGVDEHVTTATTTTTVGAATTKAEEHVPELKVSNSGLGLRTPELDSVFSNHVVSWNTLKSILH